MRRLSRRQLLAAAVLAVVLVFGLVLARTGRGVGRTGVAPVAAGTGADRGSPGPELAAGPADPRRDRSSGGARAAALAYTAGVQQEVVYLPDPEARRVLSGWMAPGVDGAELDRTAEGLETTRKALLGTRGQAWWVVSPLAAKNGPFTPERAQVSVWLVRVLASGGTSSAYVPTAGWLTATVDLVWADGPGWSVWSVATAPGPVPGATVAERPAPSAEFVAALDGFSLVKEHR